MTTPSPRSIRAFEYDLPSKADGSRHGADQGDRGDDIVEVALRSRSDTDCFNGIEDEVDRVLLGTNTVESNAVEVFEVVARKNKE